LKFNCNIIIAKDDLANNLNKIYEYNYETLRYFIIQIIIIQLFVKIKTVFQL